MLFPLQKPRKSNSFFTKRKAKQIKKQKTKQRIGKQNKTKQNKTKQNKE